MEKDKSPVLEAREAADYGSPEWHSEQRRLMGSDRYPSLSESRAAYAAADLVEESEGLTTEQARLLVSEESADFDLEEEEDLDEVIRITPSASGQMGRDFAAQQAKKSKAKIGLPANKGGDLYSRTAAAAGAKGVAARTQPTEAVEADADLDEVVRIQPGEGQSRNAAASNMKLNKKFAAAGNTTAGHFGGMIAKNAGAPKVAKKLGYSEDEDLDEVVRVDPSNVTKIGKFHSAPAGAKRLDQPHRDAAASKIKSYKDTVRKGYTDSNSHSAASMARIAKDAGAPKQGDKFRAKVTNRTSSTPPDGVNKAGKVEHVENVWNTAANTRGITGAGSMEGIVGDLSEAVDGKRSEQGEWVAEQRRLMGFDR